MDPIVWMGPPEKLVAFEQVNCDPLANKDRIGLSRDVRT